ncbi:MAG TPA: hypothetical protein VLH19_04025 [Patescibacteria group bacterium]|nr:hypothetical protein [Patescibacteria group bacterium]
MRAALAGPLAFAGITGIVALILSHIIGDFWFWWALGLAVVYMAAIPFFGVPAVWLKFPPIFEVAAFWVVLLFLAWALNFLFSGFSFWLYLTIEFLVGMFVLCLSDEVREQISVSLQKRRKERVDHG